jgi:hypothetical protein
VLQGGVLGLAGLLAQGCSSLRISATSAPLGFGAVPVSRLDQVTVPAEYRYDLCQVSCDHIPRRSWALFRARDVMRGVIESFKAEKPT